MTDHMNLSTVVNLAGLSAIPVLVYTHGGGGARRTTPTPVR
jgi:hypothetical protein